MFDAAFFVTCVRDGLKQRGFGHKRIKEITDDFKGRLDAYTAQGKDSATAGILAMKDVFENISKASQERAKRTAKMLAVQADNIQRINQADTVPVSKFVMDGKKGSRGTAAARAAVSLIEDDPRFKGTSYSGNLEAVRGQLYALFGDTLRTVGKGAFGRQKGKAHLPNIAREVLGFATGDAHAKAVADAWLKITDVTVDLFQAAGGSMGRLKRYLPQSQNAVRMVKAGEERWIKVHLEGTDWNKTRWPDGSIIPVKERPAVLKMVYNTITTDGANRIDPSAFRGRGRAVGNMVDDHRFLHYKDAETWLAVHNEFGDGSVMDVLFRHIEDMSHKIALIETFGPNPEMTALNLQSIVRNKAAQFGAEAVADAEAVLKNKFSPMFENIMRQNPMDPHSRFGALVTGTANILTSAQLGSAALLAIPGDFIQSAAVRALNGMGMFDGVSMYMKALATDKAFMMDIANQSGFVMDQAVMATYATTRFTGVATVGPALTRHVAEGVMRLSLLSGHTQAARWTVQAEFMGALNRFRNTSFEELPFRAVMERYGITPEEWNVMRTGIGAWEPRAGIKFLRPIDVLKTDIPNKQSLYRKFQVMITEEARRGVPEATIEASVALRGNTRPDTLIGAIAYSFSMYKNFPMSFAMIYGRLGLTLNSKAGRLAFYAGLGASMTMVGALGTQMREVSQGRDPIPMDSAAFWGKAFLSGGALSIWGDFLFSGVNEYNAGPKDIVGGPLAAFLGDTTNLVFGDVFEWANHVGSLSGTDFQSKTGARAVEWARRYTPGTSIWWARLALQREVFDRLQLLADPKARQKQRAKAAKQKRDKGNEYFWSPGDDAPSRWPQFGG